MTELIEILKNSISKAEEIYNIYQEELSKVKIITEKISTKQSILDSREQDLNKREELIGPRESKISKRNSLDKDMDQLIKDKEKLEQEKSEFTVSILKERQLLEEQKIELTSREANLADQTRELEKDKQSYKKQIEDNIKTGLKKSGLISE